MIKLIKQISTGKIVYREDPHTDKTLGNAKNFTSIDLDDLEVVEENWTNDEWASALHNQLDYADKRRPLYGTWEEQLDMMYHGTWKDHVAKVKADIPKGNS
jgi:hypothetical protein